ncbi:N-acyl homoserine lactonase family protein [Xanthobacter sediminis]
MGERNTGGWEVLALHYATAQRPAQDLALDFDPHDLPGRIDYFIWVIRNAGRVIVVDTGYLPEEGARRARTLLRHPVAALADIGIDAGAVPEVVLTHLHYDHAGNLPSFPRARFHLQDREMAYGTGRCMCHPRMRKPFFVEDVLEAVRMVFAGRVQFHDGDAEIAPGVSLHLVGGHSRGLQVVRIDHPQRPVVLAVDALHFGAHLPSGNVFPLFADYPDVLEGYRRLRELAGPSGVIVPGHDPAVLRDFPPLSAGVPHALRLL